MKAEATSITCSISFNMSMALFSFSALHFPATNFKSKVSLRLFIYKAKIFRGSVKFLCHDMYQI